MHLVHPDPDPDAGSAYSCKLDRRGMAQVGVGCQVDEGRQGLGQGEAQIAYSTVLTVTV